MKTKIFATMLVLFALFTAVGFAATSSNQNAMQNSNQAVMGSAINNSTINQSAMQKSNQNSNGVMPTGPNANLKTAQNASQGVQGSNLINSTVNQNTMQKSNQNVSSMNSVSPIVNKNSQGMPTGPNVNLNTSQNASQSVQGSNLINSTVNQNLVQNSNQNVTWNVQNYFVMNTQKVSVTSEQQTVIVTRTQDFLTSFPRMREFIMPLVDLEGFESAGRADVVILNVGSIPNPRISFAGIINIPLIQLTARINEIPIGRTIAVFGDNDIESATGMTLLRLQGFNAWAVRTGVC